MAFNFLHYAEYYNNIYYDLSTFLTANYVKICKLHFVNKIKLSRFSFFFQKNEIVKHSSRLLPVCN